MRTNGQREFRPHLEGIEERCLLSSAGLEIVNQSAQSVSFELRWSPSSAWSVYTLSPGQNKVLWTTYSSSLSPQLFYGTGSSAGSPTTVVLAPEFNQWSGIGTPPASAAEPYEFVDTSTGAQLYYAGNLPTPTLSPNASATTTANWSGYVAAANLTTPQINTVSAVSGSWNVPTVTGASNTPTYSCTWVGIDGSSTVEQIGTEQNVINGHAVYYAWYEMYSTGKGQPEQVITSMTVTPGDSITASVQYIASGTYAGDFCLTIDDNSWANDYFVTYENSAPTQSPVAPRSCAEWIVEAPEVGGSIATVPNFGTVTFSNAFALINGVWGAIDSPSWQSTAVNMASNGVTYDTASILTTSGTGFVMTYVPSAGPTVLANPNVAAGTRFGGAAGVTLPARKQSPRPAVSGPASAGAMQVWGFRTLVRQMQREQKLFGGTF